MLLCPIDLMVNPKIIKRIKILREPLTGNVQFSFELLQIALFISSFLDIIHSDKSWPQVMKAILFYQFIKLCPPFYKEIRNIIKSHERPILIFIKPVEEGRITLISFIVHKNDVYPILVGYIFPHLFFLLRHTIKPKEVLIVYSGGPPIYVDGDIRPEVPDEIPAKVIVVEYIPSHIV